MKLKLKEGATIPTDNFGVEHPNAVINGYDICIDRYLTMTVKVGLFHSATTLEKKPISLLTWVFTKEPIAPQFNVEIDEEGNETQGEMYYTGHSGSAGILSVLDVLKPIENPVLVVPNTELSKAWILAQKDWNGVPIGDNWEFYDDAMEKYNESKDCRVWGDAVKARVCEQKPLISQWEIQQSSYENIPNYNAHWHIDPPYNNKAGSRYPFSEINYEHLANWCRSRNG